MRQGLEPIVQVLLSPRIGGAESVAQMLREEWSAAGLDTSTVYLDTSGSGGGRVARLRRLHAQLRDARPGSLLSHSYLPSLYSRVLRGAAPAVHTVLHSASDDFSGAKARTIERLQHGRTASVIAVSPGQLQTYLSHFPGFNPSTVIGNGVSRHFQSTPAHKDPRVVVTIARVAAQKRPDFWLKVVKRMQVIEPSLRFEWWGPLGDDRASNEVMESLPANARYCGPTASASEVLANSDILFHTSAREAAASIAVLEAAVAGRPVVYPDSLPSPDGSSHWRWQYVADDTNDAARMLSELVAEWRAASTTASDYARTARTKFGAEEMASRYLAWIANV